MLCITGALQAQEKSNPDTFNAQTMKQAADSAYASENYARARELYETMLQKGEDAMLYYNLGNTCYKLGDIPHAVLNYERAALLAPADDDIKANLTFIQGKVIDKITPQSDMFFFRWWSALVNSLNLDVWAYYGVAGFILMLIMTGLFFFARDIRLRKTGFIAALVLLAATALSNVCAWQQYERLVQRNGAIVMEPSVAVKSTPGESGTTLFMLHEGTKVEIVDASMREWKEIKLADGKVGWIKTAHIEII